MRPPPHPFSPGLLCDAQIAELATTQDMIVPFVSGQVREQVTKFKPRSASISEATETLMEGPIFSLSGTGVVKRVVSYGLGHYGYDMRVADEFKVFYAKQRYGIGSSGGAEVQTPIVDPKALDPDCFEEVRGDCVIPPNSFALARSLERFKIPRGVLAQVIGKSTYARCGLIVNVTPLEPEWEGYVTLEISNTTPLPARVYANEGIAQVLFFMASLECRTSYAEKDIGGGKYQGQGPNIVLPRM